jgi:hypothetical protein
MASRTNSSAHFQIGKVPPSPGPKENALWNGEMSNCLGTPLHAAFTQFVSSSFCSFAQPALSRFVNKSVSEFSRGLQTVWTGDKPICRPQIHPAPHTSTLHDRFESPMSIGWWSTRSLHITTVTKIVADASCSASSARHSGFMARISLSYNMSGHRLMCVCVNMCTPMEGGHWQRDKNMIFPYHFLKSNEHSAPLDYEHPTLTQKMCFRRVQNKLQAASEKMKQRHARQCEWNCCTSGRS